MAKTKTKPGKTTATKAKGKSKQGVTKAKKAPTSASKGLKTSSKASTSTSRAPTKTSKAQEETIKVPAAGPALQAIPLVAPLRRGRSLLNREEALQLAEVRLKLAWLHRATLDPVLPQKPPFHAHAWTALRLLQSQERDEQAESEKTQVTLEALLAELVKIRKIVAATTSRDDAVREKVGFGKTLRATRALIDDGESILRGAEQLQESFPALTSALLARGKAALSKASAAVARSKNREVEASVSRANHADEQQLALDVVLYSIDHLRAAALSVLSESRPKLAALLEAPLEIRSRGGEEHEEAEPAPTPVSGGDK